MFHAVHTSLAEVAEDAGATPLETRDAFATSVVDALITPSVTTTANLRARGHSPFAPVYAGLLLKRAVRWPHRWGLRYFELTLRGFDRGGDHPSQESQSFVRYRDWDGSGPWRAMAVGSSELFLPRDARGACAVFGRAELQTNRDDGAACVEFALATDAEHPFRLRTVAQTPPALVAALAALGWPCSREARQEGRHRVPHLLLTCFGDVDAALAIARRDDPAARAFRDRADAEADEIALRGLVAVAVPPGAGAGAELTVELPDGRRARVAAPAGVGAGSTFHFVHPPPPGTVVRARVAGLPRDWSGGLARVRLADGRVVEVAVPDRSGWGSGDFEVDVPHAGLACVVARAAVRGADVRRARDVEPEGATSATLGRATAAIGLSEAPPRTELEGGEPDAREIRDAPPPPLPEVASTPFPRTVPPPPPEDASTPPEAADYRAALDGLFGWRRAEPADADDAGDEPPSDADAARAERLLVMARNGSTDDDAVSVAVPPPLNTSNDAAIAAALAAGDDATAAALTAAVAPAPVATPVAADTSNAPTAAAEPAPAANARAGFFHALRGWLGRANHGGRGGFVRQISTGGTLQWAETGAVPVERGRVPLHVKKARLETALARRRVPWESGHQEVAINRDRFFESVCSRIGRIRTPYQWRQTWRFKFEGEPGIDAGGVARDFWNCFGEEFFDPLRGLFKCASSERQTLRRCIALSHYSLPLGTPLSLAEKARTKT